MVNRAQTAGGRVFDALNIFIMGLLAVLFVFPFWHQVVVSFTSAEQSGYLGIRLWPSITSAAAYVKLYESGRILVGYYNTVFRSLVGGALCIVFTMLGAFFLSKKHLPLRKAATVFILITMFFNGGMVPNYLLIRNLGLLDSRWSLILPGITSAWFIILARNFLMTLPEALDESAMIDGANPFQVLYRIKVPLSLPIISVIALWSVVGHWNAWFDCMIYIRDRDLHVLQVILRYLLAASEPEQELGGAILGQGSMIFSNALKAAAVMVSIGPIIAVYPFLQKYFVKGLLVGSLKG